MRRVVAGGHALRERRLLSFKLAVAELDSRHADLHDDASRILNEHSDRRTHACTVQHGEVVQLAKLGRQERDALTKAATDLGTAHRAR
jgi:hypothetical protein